jgi:arylformamidase
VTGALAQEAALPRDVLDRDYSARATVTPQEFNATMEAYLRQTDAARALAGARLGLGYDLESDQSLDLFGAEAGQSKPLFIFIHGGYWRALSKEHSGFMAPMLARRGIASAAIDYRLAPEASMTEIVREVRAAVAYFWHNALDLGVDRDRIFVGGSSAGAHLGGTLLSPGWQAGHGLPGNVIRGALLVSGLYDLAPIAASHVQDWVGLSPEEVEEFSPIRHLPNSGRAIIALAETEAAGFHRQSRAYSEVLAQNNVDVDFLHVPGRNHFDVILDLAAPDTALSQALLAMILAD